MPKRHTFTSCAEAIDTMLEGIEGGAWVRSAKFALPYTTRRPRDIRLLAQAFGRVEAYYDKAVRRFLAIAAASGWVQIESNMTQERALLSFDFNTVAVRWSGTAGFRMQHTDTGFTAYSRLPAPKLRKTTGDQLWPGAEFFLTVDPSNGEGSGLRFYESKRGGEPRGFSDKSIEALCDELVATMDHRLSMRQASVLVEAKAQRGVDLTEEIRSDFENSRFKAAARDLGGRGRLMVDTEDTTLVISAELRMPIENVEDAEHLRRLLFLMDPTRSERLS
jgi:hypothetical protein